MVKKFVWLSIRNDLLIPAVQWLSRMVDFVL